MNIYVITYQTSKSITTITLEIEAFTKAAYESFIDAVVKRDSLSDRRVAILSIFKLEKDI